MIYKFQFSTTQVSEYSRKKNDNHNKAIIRTYLISKLSELPINDISSVKIIASALSAASSNTEQISRESAVKLFAYLDFYV
jgi:hypothetical protein